MIIEFSREMEGHFCQWRVNFERNEGHSVGGKNSNRVIKASEEEEEYDD